MGKTDVIIAYHLAKQASSAKTETASFKTTGSHPLNSPITKGISFDTDIFVSPNIVSKETDGYTFKLLKKGKYQIGYSLNANIDSANTVPGLFIKLVMQATLQSDSTFADDSTGLQRETRKTVQTTSSTPVTPSAVDTVYDECAFITSQPGMYIKVMTYGPTGNSSIQPGASLTITYLGD